MTGTIPVFKPWVPEWLIRLTLLLVLLPGLVLFILSITNVNAAAGYYGISPNDVQYSIIVFAAAIASFVVLEGRFSTNLASKEYFLIGVLLLMGTCYLCYTVHSFFYLLVVRYMQGLLTSGTINISITLMFNRLQGERAKEIAYSIAYGILLTALPLSTVTTSLIIDAFDFNVIYKVAIYSYLPGALLMFIIMNNVRIRSRLPLSQLDWASFVIYTLGLCLGGYVLIYGQQYNWLDDPRISGCVVVGLLLFVLFIVRQLHMEIPYIYIQVFKRPFFLFAVLLLFLFYLCRGAFSITTSFMGNVLGLDPIHIGYLLIYNIAAIIVSVIISSRLVLLKKPMRMIFICGFSLLLIFHVYMCFIFSTQVDGSSLILPLIIQGLGLGMLMMPIILFLISSSPPEYGNTGSAVGILIRFSGFSSAIALVNYFQLHGQNNHFNRFQDHLSGLDPEVVQRLAVYTHSMTARGVAPDQAARIANGLLNRTVGIQVQLRSAMDYYQTISWMLVGVILFIIFFPSIQRIVIQLGSKQPAPIVY